MGKKPRKMARDGRIMNKIKKSIMTGIATISLLLSGISYADILSSDKAFQFIGKLEQRKVVIYGSTQSGYKIYKDSLKIKNNKSNVKIEEMIKSHGKKQYNEFIEKEQEEYEGNFLIEIPFVSSSDKTVIEFDLEAQGCTVGLCYSPFLTHIKLKQ